MKHRPAAATGIILSGDMGQYQLPHLKTFIGLNYSETLLALLANGAV